MSNDTTVSANGQSQHQLSGIRRCVTGGDEIAEAIQAVASLDELKSIIKNNVTLINKIRSFCRRENITSMNAILRDIGRMWKQFVDLTDDPEFHRFQDFMLDLLSNNEERNYLGILFVEYLGYVKAEKNLERGEPVKPFYPNATIDIPDDLTLPSILYSIDNRGGVWRQNSLICSGALIITKRIISLDDERYTYELAFQTEIGKWATAKIPSDYLSDSKKFTPYIGYGIQVGTNTIKAAMEYLSAFTHSNGDNIPTVQGTSHLGWNKDKILIDTQNPNLEIIVEPHLNPTLKAIISKGTLDEWVENVFNIAMEDRTNGKFLLGLCSTLGSLFLEPLGRPNGWFLHLHGASRSGKSTTMKAIASAIGYPINQGVWRSWDNTKVYLERYCAFMGSIGVFLDEAKAEMKNIIQETVYMIANGMGRGRGTVGGVAQTLTWKLNVVSTGEFDLKETANQEGFENRIISLTPKPGCSFFKNGNCTATILEDNMGKYYGTLIKAYAPLVEDLGQDEIVIRFKEAKNLLLARLDDEHKQSGRVHTFLDYFSIMLVALDLFMAKILILEPEQTHDYFEVFLIEFDEFLGGIVETREDRSEKVVNAIRSLFFCNRSKFKADGKGFEPSVGGWWGKIISIDQNSVTVGIRPEIVVDQLKRSGYSVSEFERAAIASGEFIRCGDKKHMLPEFNINGGKIRGYKLKFEAKAEEEEVTDQKDKKK
ncbi:DNA/RNA helicase, superfamily II [Desulfosporosinus acidiphilus SJ4]|uniref:DNA/RNA helicase, superfamily II n=1 Tax=Desulfosporosinus acidiphilus (strain DSM 22704 / JCM 16185 / SJ4) TaxID=646529 RepID=I4D587_DESAJ|nr:DUF927 domain-containing protein [Desulfosporosinus acidiphilus]AFM40961.1 DNA/RNA helicase, superfamily II [Desulfosporosinus acidiphilus SJ4]